MVSQREGQTAGPSSLGESPHPPECLPLTQGPCSPWGQRAEGGHGRCEVCRKQAGDWSMPVTHRASIHISLLLQYKVPAESLEERLFCPFAQQVSPSLHVSSKSLTTSTLNKEEPKIFTALWTAGGCVHVCVCVHVCEWECVCLCAYACVGKHMCLCGLAKSILPWAGRALGRRVNFHNVSTCLLRH